MADRIEREIRSRVERGFPTDTYTAADVTHLLALVDELRERAEKAEAVLDMWAVRAVASPDEVRETVEEIRSGVRAALRGEESKR